jgi:DNA-binding XRE family transcriptional regulator
VKGEGRGKSTTARQDERVPVSELDARLERAAGLVAAELSPEALAVIQRVVLPEVYLRGEEPDEAAPGEALPGSEAKVRELEARAARNQSLHRGDDPDDPEGYGLLASPSPGNNAPGPCSSRETVVGERGAGRAEVGAAKTPRRLASRHPDAGEPGPPPGPINAAKNTSSKTFVPPPPATLGQRLRRWREWRGLTRKGLARRIGVSHQALWYLERDHCRPTLPVLLALADVLAVPTLDDLVGRRPRAG